MANEIVQLKRNVGTAEAPVYESWYPAVVASAIRMGVDPQDPTYHESIVEYMTNRINEVRKEILGGASVAFDTLKEIEDYIEEHQDVAEALQNSIINKVDKEDGKGLSSNDFTDEYKEMVDNLKTQGGTITINENRKDDIGGLISVISGDMTTSTLLDYMINKEAIGVNVTGSFSVTDETGDTKDIPFAEHVFVPDKCEVSLQNLTYTINPGSYTISNVTILGDNATQPTTLSMSSSLDFTCNFVAKETKQYSLELEIKVSDQQTVTKTFDLFSIESTNSIKAYHIADKDNIVFDNLLAQCVAVDGESLTINSFESGYLVFTGYGDLKRIIDGNGFNISNIFEEKTIDGVSVLVTSLQISNIEDAMVFTFKKA